MANVLSIVERGILSHERAAKVQHASAAMENVQQLRSRKTVPGGRPLHQYANLYIDARNVMLYKLKERHLDLCVLRVGTDVLDLPDVVIADGNAAGYMTRFGPSPQGLGMIDKAKVFADWWRDSLEERRARCAEVLVPDSVPPEYLLGAYVSCEEARQRFEGLNWTKRRLDATINEHLFYLRRV
jgi:hypothetical protein